MADPQPNLSRMEEIQILLAEYNTLRTELLQRNTTAFQALGVAGTAFIAVIVFTFTQSIWGGLILLVILPTLIWIVLRMFDFDTRNAAVRIAELEAAINDKAGSKLLAWETDYGLPSLGAAEKRRLHVVGPPLSIYRWCQARFHRMIGSN